MKTILKSAGIFLVLTLICVSWWPHNADGSFDTTYLYIPLIASLLISIAISFNKKSLSDKKDFLNREYKWGGYIGSVISILAGLSGLIYSFVYEQYKCKHFGPTSILFWDSPSCYKWALWPLFVYGIGGIFIGFATGAIIGVVFDLFIRKRN